MLCRGSGALPGVMLESTAAVMDWGRHCDDGDGGCCFRRTRDTYTRNCAYEPWRPSRCAAFQTSFSFLPVASAPWISGHIHRTQPMDVAGSSEGNERRFTMSAFLLFRS